jgi:glucose/arabinose dehydrogenase
MTKRKLLIACGVGAAVLATLGLGGAAVCKKTDFNCHLRSAKPFTIEVDRGKTGGSQWIDPRLRSTVLVRRLDFPTDFDFLPDGRILIAGRTGLIQMIDHGRVLTKPVLDLRGDVSTWQFRGLVALVVDPAPTRPLHFYVVYSIVDPAHPDLNSGSPTTERVSRFTLDGNVARRSSEKIILGHVTGGSCVPRYRLDCLPADRDHIGADIVFLRDGSLMLSTGDGGRDFGNARLAQNVNALGGKILHVDRSGHGLPDNPFWNGNANANRSKVWAYGFRNPFRIAALPDGTIVAADVGYNSMEELDRVQRGADYGWPCLEGTMRTPEFRQTPFCVAYYRNDSARQAWFAFHHHQWQSLTGGTSLADATKLPESFRSDYVFGDWFVSKLWVTDMSTVGKQLVPTSHALLIEKGAAGPVRMRVGPDGALYVLAINIGHLARVVAS